MVEYVRHFLQTEDMIDDKTLQAFKKKQQMKF